MSRSLFLLGVTLLVIHLYGDVVPSAYHAWVYGEGYCSFILNRPCAPAPTEFLWISLHTFSGILLLVMLTLNSFWPYSLAIEGGLDCSHCLFCLLAIAGFLFHVYIITLVATFLMVIEEEYGAIYLLALLTHPVARIIQDFL